MLIAICTTVLVGALLGLRFRVFVLLPVTVLALLSIAVVGAAEGAPAMSIFVAMFFVGTALQLSYLAGGFAVIAIAPASNFKLQDIQEHMEVVGSDGGHVGAVDHIEDTRCLVLTADDPIAGGRPHLISINWVRDVTDKVHLNRSSNEAVSEWLVAA